MFILFVCFFGLTVWLGLHLLVREQAFVYLRWAGAGLLLYALCFAGAVVLHSAVAVWLLSIGLFTLAVDGALARHNSLQLGERFWPDLIRSLEGALLAALLFGLPVALTMRATTGATPAMSLLLFIIIALAIATQVLAEPVQRLLDRLAFAAQPQLQQARAELRATAEVLPRVDDTLDPTTLAEAEFVRLTRRALSHYGDLPRLAASPLTRLPAINARLAERGLADHTLERATELKQLLHAAILRLKPTNESGFQAGDGWRHYNALYYPYVVGLKPYSRRADHEDLDPASQQALEWLRTQIPERTLHNWQNAAAKLVAQDLRERR